MKGGLGFADCNLHPSILKGVAPTALYLFRLTETSGLC
jgi:hypothetical protein